MNFGKTGRCLIKLDIFYIINLIDRSNIIYELFMSILFPLFDTFALCKRHILKPNVYLTFLMGYCATHFIIINFIITNIFYLISGLSASVSIDQIIFTIFTGYLLSLMLFRKLRSHKIKIVC